MNDPHDHLSAAFAELREADRRRDFSRLEYALETRLMPQFNPRDQGGLAAPWRLRILWKMLAGTAAFAGIFFLWMTSHGALDLHGEEPLWALWGGADASVNLFPN